jgi:hypothetical protein
MRCPEGNITTAAKERLLEWFLDNSFRITMQRSRESEFLAEDWTLKRASIRIELSFTRAPGSEPHFIQFSANRHGWPFLTKDFDRFISECEGCTWEGAEDPNKRSVVWPFDNGPKST